MDEMFCAGRLIEAVTNGLSGYVFDEAQFHYLERSEGGVRDAHRGHVEDVVVGSCC